MKVDSELQFYVIKNYRNFFNEKELEISNNIGRQLKFEWLPDEEKKVFRERLGHLVPDESSFMTTEEQENFYNSTAERIINEENLFINRCPHCGQLARTTKARQAKCGHSWRDFNLREEDGKFKWVKEE